MLAGSRLSACSASSKALSHSLRASAALTWAISLSALRLVLATPTGAKAQTSRTPTAAIQVKRLEAGMLPVFLRRLARATRVVSGLSSKVLTQRDFLLWREN